MAVAGCDGGLDRLNVRTDWRRAGNVLMVNDPRGRLCIGRTRLLSRFQAKNGDGRRTPWKVVTVCWLKFRRQVMRPSHGV